MLDFGLLARQCAPTVAPQTMAAIVKTESGFQPLAIGVNGGARLQRQPTSKEEAVVTAKWLISNGYNIDMGLGQVNSANLVRTWLTVEEAFDACRNLGAAAQILTGNYLAVRSHLGDDQKALHAAVSTYNTGSPTRGFANGYVQRVVANGNALQALNGQGTPAVRPIPLAVVATPAAPRPTVTLKGAALPGAIAPAVTKRRAVPVRLVATEEDQSEIFKLMIDQPDKTPDNNGATALQNPSVYERDAQGIDVYR